MSINDLLKTYFDDLDYSSVKNIISPLLEPTIIKEHGIESSLTSRCLDVLLFSFFFLHKKDCSSFLDYCLQQEDRVFLLEIGTFILYIYLNVEWLGRLYSYYYENDNDAFKIYSLQNESNSNSNKKSLIEVIEPNQEISSLYHNNQDYNDYTKKGNNYISTFDLSSILQNCLSILNKEKNSPSSRIYTIFMDISIYIYNSTILHFISIYTSKIDTLSSLLHTEDTQLYNHSNIKYLISSTEPYISRGNQEIKEKTQDEQDHQLLNSIQQLKEIYTYLLLWIDDHKSRDFRKKMIEIQRGSLRYYEDLYNKGMIQFYQYILIYNNQEKDGANSFSTLILILSCVYNNKLCLLTLLQELSLTLPPLYIYTFRKSESIDILSKQLTILKDPIMKEQSETDDQYEYKVYIYSILFRELLGQLGGLPSSVQNGFIKNNISLLYSICMSSLHVSIPSSSPSSIRYIVIYPVIMYLFSLNIFPADMMTSNASLFISMLKTNDPISEAITSLLSTLCLSEETSSSIFPLLFAQLSLYKQKYNYIYNTEKNKQIDNDENEDIYYSQMNTSKQSIDNSIENDINTNINKEDRNTYINILHVFMNLFNKINQVPQTLITSLSPYLFDFMNEKYLYIQMANQQILKYFDPSIVMKELISRYTSLNNNFQGNKYFSNNIYQTIVLLMLHQPDLVTTVTCIYSYMKDLTPTDSLYTLFDRIIKRYIQIETNTSKYIPLSEYLYTNFTNNCQNPNSLHLLSLFFDAIHLYLFPKIYPSLLSIYISFYSLSGKNKTININEYRNQTQHYIPLLILQLYTYSQLNEDFSSSLTQNDNILKNTREINQLYFNRIFQSIQHFSSTYFMSTSSSLCLSEAEIEFSTILNQLFVNNDIHIYTFICLLLLQLLDQNNSSQFQKLYCSTISTFPSLYVYPIFYGISLFILFASTSEYSEDIIQFILHHLYSYCIQYIQQYSELSENDTNILQSLSYTTNYSLSSSLQTPVVQHKIPIQTTVFSFLRYFFYCIQNFSKENWEKDSIIPELYNNNKNNIVNSNIVHNNIVNNNNNNIVNNKSYNIDTSLQDKYIGNNSISINNKNKNEQMNTKESILIQEINNKQSISITTNNTNSLWGLSHECQEHILISLQHILSYLLFIEINQNNEDIYIPKPEKPLIEVIDDDTKNHINIINTYILLFHSLIIHNDIHSISLFNNDIQSLFHISITSSLSICYLPVLSLLIPSLTKNQTLYIMNLFDSYLINQLVYKEMKNQILFHCLKIILLGLTQSQYVSDSITHNVLQSLLYRMIDQSLQIREVAFGVISSILICKPELYKEFTTQEILLFKKQMSLLLNESKSKQINTLAITFLSTFP
ncbi:hypothetical protein WA158_002872 [Blastocystis sp. Blastoise]